ncbi:MAG: glycosyltransferase family 2 protein [Nitrospirota bacterium]|nr:glycosyltransferase family 2 protein [Nitrospirota bacterium]
MGDKKMTGEPKVSVVLPAFREERVIGAVIRGVRSVMGSGCEIIVVDDGSPDNTGKAAEEAGARVVRHPYNMGNGAAVKSGIRAATGDVIVMMDSDGQHQPEDILRLLEQVGPYDMVIGARTKASETSVHRDVANALYNKFAAYLTKKEILDLTSGFRAIKADIAKRFVYLLPNTFSYPTTLTLSLIRSGHSVTFIPIVAKKREGKSKIKLLKDGVRFFLIMLKIATLYSPFRVFLPVSVSFFGLGIGYYIYTFITEHRFTNMSALLISNGIIIFMMALIAEQIAQLRLDRTEETAHRHREKG